METIMAFLIIILAYLFGSINCAILICKMMSLPSPRSVGSGNPGATNVLRLGNKKAAGLTLAGDVLKGVIPVLIGHALHLPVNVLCWIALAAILGHIFPIFFNFKGGKGVATAIGAIFALNIFLGLAVGATWLLIAGLLRMSSLSSLVAMIMTPIYGYCLLGNTTIFPLVLLAVIVLLRHKANIKRILAGTEPKIGNTSFRFK